MANPPVPPASDPETQHWESEFDQFLGTTDRASKTVVQFSQVRPRGPVITLAIQAALKRNYRRAGWRNVEFNITTDATTLNMERLEVWFIK